MKDLINKLTNRKDINALKKDMQSVKKELKRNIKKKEGPEEIDDDNIVINKRARWTCSLNDYLMHQILTDEEREAELKRIFYNKTKYYLDLDNPRTFNQKIQWMKLNYCNEIMEKCVDKYTFKDYVRETVGEEYVVPLYGAWDNENDIDWDSLPDKFVFKSNLQSDSKHIIIVKNKNNINKDLVKTIMCGWLQPRNTLITSFCKAYRNSKPMIMAEKFVEGMTSNLPDYKFMCFGGEVEMLFVVSERSEEMSVTFFDLEWNQLPFSRKYPCSPVPLIKPVHFEEMKELAKILCKPFPFVRVDFYDTPEQLYLGELTFYPGGGYEVFEPMEWDYKLGDMLNLPEKNI